MLSDHRRPSCSSHLNIVLNLAESTTTWGWLECRVEWGSVIIPCARFGGAGNLASFYDQLQQAFHSLLALLNSACASHSYHRITGEIVLDPLVSAVAIVCEQICRDLTLWLPRFVNIIFICELTSSNLIITVSC